jgi:hypothetical protein
MERTQNKRVMIYTKSLSHHMLTRGIVNTPLDWQFFLKTKTKNKIKSNGRLASHLNVGK